MKELEYYLKGLRAPFYKLFNRDKNYYFCPICSYHGPFIQKHIRLDAKCPKCGEVERGRLQWLVLQKILSRYDIRSMDVLHIAPENYLRKYLRTHSASYISSDLTRADVDTNFDIQDIPFQESTFDLVYASHVLEYPNDDILAISEIKRILKSNGLAILPVPILHKNTVDLKERNPRNYMMHEPGLDYFERFNSQFERVELFRSEMFDKKHQPFIYLGTEAEKFALNIGNGWCSDIVPVCYKSP